MKLLLPAKINCIINSRKLAHECSIQLSTHLVHWATGNIFYPTIGWWLKICQTIIVQIDVFNICLFIIDINIKFTKDFKCNATLISVKRRMVLSIIIPFNRNDTVQTSWNWQCSVYWWELHPDTEGKQPINHDAHQPQQRNGCKIKPQFVPISRDEVQFTTIYYAWMEWVVRIQLDKFGGLLPVYYHSKRSETGRQKWIIAIRPTPYYRVPEELLMWFD